MSKKRVFVSFDYDHDNDLKTLLIGQARNPNSPFEVTDMSIKEEISNNWKLSAQRRIKSCDLVIVVCGEHTSSATGVSAELRIAQEEKVPYFLLTGRKNRYCVKPLAALPSDKMYQWSWENLGWLINGFR